MFLRVLDLKTIYFLKYFLCFFLNRNMIGGLQRTSKNQSDRQSQPLIGIPTMFCWLQVHLDSRYRTSHRYVLGQLLDLIYLAKINLFEPRLWPMGHGKLPLGYNTSIFIVKKIKSVFFCLLYSGTWVHKRIRLKFKVPKYGSTQSPTSEVLIDRKRTTQILRAKTLRVLRQS